MQQHPNADATRLEKGQFVLSTIEPTLQSQAIEGVGDIAPDFARFTVEFPFGDLYSRPGLDLRSREVATIAALTALGTMPQLRLHVGCGLNVGLTREEIVEIIMQMTAYAGFPAAWNGLVAAKDVFAERDQKDV